MIYHRAAKLDPSNANHLVGAKRAAEAITASVNPNEKLGRVLKEPSRLVCPELAAKKAREIASQSSEPTQDIAKIIKLVNHFSQ